MRCCVPSCKNTSTNVSSSETKGISFHGLPSEVHLRAAWLTALGIQDSHLLDSAMVCSQHFLDDDIYETESGLRQIGADAIPSTVQVCMICLDTDSKMFLMSEHKLEEAYITLTGYLLYDQGKLKQSLCVQCAQRLINFSRFRDKSLRARELMMDLVKKHELITRQHIKIINRTKNQLNSDFVVTTLGPDHCDLYILDSSEDKHTKSEKIRHSAVSKNEESYDSSLDEDMEVTKKDARLKSDFLVTLGPDHCDLYDSEDKQTESKPIRYSAVMKNEESYDAPVDEEIEVTKEDDNTADDVNELVACNYLLPESEMMLETKQVVEMPDPLKYESASFQCTLCSEEFDNEHAYMHHKCMHDQNVGGDAACGTSQVCKPHTAASSSKPSRRTKKKQATQLKKAPSPSAHSPQTAGGKLFSNANLSIKARAKIVTLHGNGLNISQISREMGLSRNTVSLWVKRFEAEGSLKSRERTGRPPLITPSQRDFMVQKYETNGYIPTVYFANEFDTSVQTVRRALRCEGLRQRRKPAKKPYSRQRHKNK